jgi:DNA repair exonuclease SbcCD ATPase subunit
LGSWGINQSNDMAENKKQVSDLVQEILNELSTMRTNSPNVELKIIQISIEELKQSQADIKKDLSDLKKKLLDPDNGVIVKVNKNTKYRELQEEEEKQFKEMLLEHTELVKWKGTVTKTLWIIFSALVGILTKIFFVD